MKKRISVVLCLMMVLALCFGMAACGKKAPAEAPAAGWVEGQVYGSGNTSFTVSETDLDKNTVTITVKTDKDTVGAALLELNLVSGSDSEYGLMVDTVNGITLDYNKDGKYWAFYINNEYAMTGVDSTPVEEGAAYAFVAE